MFIVSIHSIGKVINSVLNIPCCQWWERKYTLALSWLFTSLNQELTQRQCCLRPLSALMVGELCGTNRLLPAELFSQLSYSWGICSKHSSKEQTSANDTLRDSVWLTSWNLGISSLRCWNTMGRRRVLLPWISDSCISLVWLYLFWDVHCNEQVNSYSDEYDCLCKLCVTLVAGGRVWFVSHFIS